MSKDRRREPRYPYRCPMEIKVNGRTQETISEDVSYRGVFVVTDDPPKLRSLISLKVTLPDSVEALDAHAMSAFVLEKGNASGRLPGVGLQFYATDGAVKSRWDSFIDSVRKKVIAPPMGGSLATNPRNYVRYPLKLAVKPRSQDELETLYTRDVSRGGMFLLSPKRVEIGTQMGVDVFHPESGEVFTLDCIVRRVQDGTPIGIGVEFHQLDEERRQAFFEFVHSAIEELDTDDLMFVEDDDPSLA